MASVLSNFQLSLLEEDFGARPGDKAFIDEWLTNGGNAIKAMRTVRPDLKFNSAKAKASRKLKAAMELDAAAKPEDRELFRYRAWKQAQIVMRANLTLDEVLEKTRRVYLHSVGDLPMRKSLVSRAEDGSVEVVDIEVRDPSLSAANTAVETLRKIGGFGVERTETTLTGSIMLDGMTDAEREARMAELAAKAGLIQADAGGTD